MKTVSYTHLDVYKRQDIGGSALSDTKECDRQNPGICVHRGNINPSVLFGDVYKRQIQNVPQSILRHLEMMQ